MRSASETVSGPRATSVDVALFWFQTTISVTVSTCWRVFSRRSVLETAAAGYAVGPQPATVTPRWNGTLLGVAPSALAGAARASSTASDRRTRLISLPTTGAQ